MLSFQRLEVYQRSIEFLALAIEIIAELPAKGHADIADQLRRAAQSQPLHIAEGAGRTSRPDIAKHYTIARGSAMECAAVLDVMRIQQTIEPQRYERGVDLLTSVVATTSVKVKAQVDVNRAMRLRQVHPPFVRRLLSRDLRNCPRRGHPGTQCSS